MMMMMMVVVFFSPRRRRGKDSVFTVLELFLCFFLTVSAKDTAFVEVVLFESSPSGDYTTYTTGLQGRFSRAGATISAEGEIVQVGVRAVSSGMPCFPLDLPPYSTCALCSLSSTSLRGFCLTHSVEIAGFLVLSCPQIRLQCIVYISVYLKDLKES
ncbi:hypothetical protein PGIGA_G00151050 [Pangasianodon gigas]|uniref:Uncharacterized protein n=1 Tax=Pangasianodon gigas TaxID=30993 RepID=A0ACC5XNW0_PANGG|nr:hypothetical protein [Pangasianodon gigas]